MKRPARLGPSALLLFAAFLAADTATQIAFKASAEAIGDIPLGGAFLAAACAAPAAWIAVALYVATYVLWMMVLQGSSLSRAFPLTALSYVTVPLVAWLAGGCQCHADPVRRRRGNRRAQSHAAGL
ncbi:hypothetical protein [Roseixanthobacter liquoris]|uniref:hypothetical protein n=1 Tax=Roseixanthobacter liquoris TaxID=3119921 RepID=UPI0037276308